MDMLLLLNIWLIAEIVKERLELGSEIWVNYGFLSSFLVFSSSVLTKLETEDGIIFYEILFCFYFFLL